MWGVLRWARTERATHSETKDGEEDQHDEREDETEEHGHPLRIMSPPPVGFCRGAAALTIHFWISHKLAEVLRTRESEVFEKGLVH